MKETDHSTDTLDALLQTLLQILARVLIQRGMTAYEAMEICRWSFVKAAIDRSFALPGKRHVSKTRAAILTGLSRREVDRLIYLRAPTQARVRAVYHRGHRILKAWHELPGYQGKDGAPLVIPVRGPAPSFESLVRECCRDITVRAMLDDLAMRGCVLLLDDGRVQVLQREHRELPLAAEHAQWTRQALESLRGLARELSEPPAQRVHELLFDTGPLAASVEQLARRLEGTAREFLDGLAQSLPSDRSQSGDTARAAVSVRIAVKNEAPPSPGQAAR